MPTQRPPAARAARANPAALPAGHAAFGRSRRERPGPRPDDGTMIIKKGTAGPPRSPMPGQTVIM
ncbi:hypothetical protein [Acrocarpospora catenulata]|uniref:hypothetical protein n=1 Tax=Acrocarpospora catenulata TaxID=2836182 RepID=UPI001BDB1138|nr:hypothetical protein [Acrocarpospora catenulata]